MNSEVLNTVERLKLEQEQDKALLKEISNRITARANILLGYKDVQEKMSGEAQPKGGYLKFRISQAEREEIEQRAMECGLNLSEYIRSKVFT